MGRKAEDSNSKAGRRRAPARFPEGILTFLLTDIEGSTPLWEQHQATMGAALTRHEALIAEAVASHGGQLIKTQGEGDSTLSVFVRASHAAAAAVSLQRRLATESWPGDIALPTRAALHTGEAELRDGDYYGQTLNRAARLRALGRGGQILLSRATTELVADQLPDGARLLDVGAHHLKGLSRPENVYALVHPDLAAPPPAVAQRAEHPDKVAFVGRDAERAWLSAALDSALGGQGQLVLVAGEPGIGKSRLAREVSDEAQADGWQVLWGRAWEEDGAPSFWPWVQIARAWMAGRGVAKLSSGFAGDAAVIGQILPELSERLPGLPAPPRLEPALARFRLFDAITNWLKRAAAEQPMVVVLDDLHRADTPSLLLLRFLARELGDARLLVVGTYRDTETPDQPFAKTLTALTREWVAHRIRLDGLNRGEVALFIELASGKPASPTVLQRIHERTSGNPFFVRELVQLLQGKGRLDHAEETIDPIEDVPLGVLDVVRGRVGELSDAAGGVLAAASVLGREFDLATLALVSDIGGDRPLELVEEALTAGLVIEVPGHLGRYRFSHILVRDALYGQLRGSRRAQLHQRAGEALESVDGSAPGTRLAELAHHFLRSPPETADRKGLEYTVQAGEHALALLAYEDAARLFEIALGRAVDAPRRCELLLALADAQMKAGATAPARETLLQAAETAKVVGASEALARAALGFGAAFDFTLGQAAVVEHFAQLLEAALQMLGPSDSPLRAQVLGRLAMTLYWVPPTQDEPTARRRRDALSAEAVQMARRLGEDGVLARVLYARCFATWEPDTLSERIALSAEVIHLGELLGEQELVLDGRRWQIVNRMESGDLPAMERELHAYVRAASRLHQPLYLYWSAILRSSQALLQGRLEEAERLSLDALTIGERLEDQDTVDVQNGVGAQIHAIRREQGRMGELEAMAAAFVAQFPEVPAWRMGLAMIYASTGQLDAARVHFDHLASDDFTHIPRDAVWIAAMAGCAEICAALGDAARAAQLYELLLPYERRYVVLSFGFAFIGSVAHFLGQLATVNSQWEQALQHFETAAAMHRRIGALPALARTGYEYARMLLDRDRPGDREQAHELLAQAVETAGELGMPWLHDKALAASHPDT
jgi:class 3 adenylate cyclase/tetratricopeptide (TPR) repeat protein